MTMPTFLAAQGETIGHTCLPSRLAVGWSLAGDQRCDLMNSSPLFVWPTIGLMLLHISHNLINQPRLELQTYRLRAVSDTKLNE